MAIADMSQRSRTAALWGFAAFAALQLGLLVAVELWRPMWSDPEYGYRLKHLRQRLAAEPGKPLLVVLGSSRIGNGLKADDLPPPEAAGPRAPIVFNMSLAGGAFVNELLVLHRMLALGIRPQYVVVEVLGPLLRADENYLLVPGLMPTPRVRWSDLDVFRRHAPESARKNYEAWAAWNAVPWYSDRYWLLSRYLPSWLESNNPTSLSVKFWRSSLSPSGWLPYGLATVTRQQYRAAFDNVSAGYGGLYATLEVSPRVDRVLRETLEVCRREKIEVLGLLLMPESSDFRNLCPPAKRAYLHSYLTGLCREYGTTLIDATTWMNDDVFADGHHMLPSGAAAFTARLWREALGPILERESGLHANAPTGAVARANRP